MNPDDEEEDGGAEDLDAGRSGKCVVVKTSTRQVYYIYIYIYILDHIPPSGRVN